MSPLGSPSYEIGQRLALLVNALEAQQDKVLFWCMRFDDRIHNRLAVRDGIRAAVQRLRTALEPLLPAHRLEGLDALLDDPELHDDPDPFDLRLGYFAHRSYLVRQRTAQEEAEAGAAYRIRVFGSEETTNDPPEEPTDTDGSVS